MGGLDKKWTFSDGSLSLEKFRLIFSERPSTFDRPSYFWTVRFYRLILSCRNTNKAEKFEIVKSRHKKCKISPCYSCYNFSVQKTLLKIFGKLFVKALNFSKFLKLLDAIRDTWKAISFHLIDYLSITNSKVKFYSTGNPTSIEKRRSIWISRLVLEKKIQPGVFSMTKTINHNYNLTWLTSFVFCLRLLFRLFIFTGSSVASSGSFDPVIASFTTFQISIFRIFETILNVLNRVN